LTTDYLQNYWIIVSANVTGFFICYVQHKMKSIWAMYSSERTNFILSHYIFCMPNNLPESCSQRTVTDDSTTLAIVFFSFLFDKLLEVGGS